MAGAQNAVEVCLAIERGERVALVADEASRAVAASIERALLDRGAIADCVSIEAVSPRPMPGAPPQVIAALERADAGVLCVQPREGELAARMAIVAAGPIGAVRDGLGLEERFLTLVGRRTVGRERLSWLAS